MVAYVTSEQACRDNPKHKRKGAGKKLKLAVRMPIEFHSDDQIEQSRSLKHRREDLSDDEADQASPWL